MKKVLLRAPLLTSSGYGVHSRQIFEWLHSLPDIELITECLNWGQTPWMLNGNLENGLIEKIMKCSRKVEPPYDVSFQVQLPDEWDTSLAKKNVGISAVVETDLCNPTWIEACNKMDHVVVPSNFTKSVLKRSGILLTPTSVIYEYFNDEILKNPTNTHNIKFETNFNFLIVGQLSATTSEVDRKNIFNTIDAIINTFQHNRDVGIVIKTNMGKGTTIDRKICINIFNQIKNAIQTKYKNKVYLLHGNMSKEEISSLYTHPQIKCLISATRGEGYGLPLIEAASAGLPVVATNWSGHLDFLGDKFAKIDYELVEIPEARVDNRIFFKGHKWANPSLADMSKKIKDVYMNLEEYKKQANVLKNEIIENFSKQKNHEIYNNIFKKYLIEK